MMGSGLFGGCCGWGSGFSTFGWLGLIFNILVIVVIIWVVIWALRRFSSNSGGANTFANQSPREILQTRYARGEITREQYQEMLNDLK